MRTILKYPRDALMVIKSPLNYPGNKSRIVKDIISYFPEGIINLYEPFVGSAVISINSNAENFFINDNSTQLIELLKYFHQSKSFEVLSDMDYIIQKYGLTDSFRNGLDYYKIEKNEGLSIYNKSAFLKLRADYNKEPRARELFALIIFGFNHYMRFNRSGMFNVPVGKVDFTLSLRNNTISTCNRMNKMNIYFSNEDYRDFIKNGLKKIEANDFYYLDPPYFITEAPYNSNWDINNEIDLYKFLDYLNEKKVKFALSNVVESNGKKNEILIDWMSKYNVIYLNRNYLNSNYRKKNLSKAIEVLIKNY